MSEIIEPQNQRLFQQTFDSLPVNWLKHLLALYLPVLATTFLLTAPHHWLVTPLFIIPLIIAHKIDSSGKEEIRAPNPDFPDWPFNLIMFIAAGFQFLNIFLLVSVFSSLPIFHIDTLFAILLVGASSGYSGITLAHEFIHRRSPLYKLVGRALLVTTFYEHFYTEHLRGHHVRVATANDPATAKHGSSFWPFYFKTVPGQFKSAWNIERKRLGDENMSPFDKRVLNNNVFQGIIAQLGLSLIIFLVFGTFSLVLFLIQAVFASRLLEIVNYFEHWGLTRAHDRVQPEDSWDTHSWFTYYGLVGLTRHADHHANPTRPYQSLRTFNESPKLPGGYITMVAMVMLNNKKFQELMDEELRKQKLGPYREALASTIASTTE
jgi:alkane 1-monooxygenase